MLDDVTHPPEARMNLWPGMTMNLNEIVEKDIGKKPKLSCQACFLQIKLSYECDGEFVFNMELSPDDLRVSENRPSGEILNVVSVPAPKKDSKWFHSWSPK